MSLDVYLYDDSRGGEYGLAQDRIYVRGEGATVEISREEWDATYPGREPVSVVEEPHHAEVYTANITHNLGRMADEAGLYEALWQPEDISASRAEHLIERLREGLHRLRADRMHYEQWNPENGWGNYDLLVRFAADALAACEENPKARIVVSR